MFTSVIFTSRSLNISVLYVPRSQELTSVYLVGWVIKYTRFLFVDNKIR